MVAVDTSFLGLIFFPGAKPPNDPSTGAPPDRVEERIRKLLEDLDTSKERIVVPTPALGEFLVLANEDAPNYLAELTNQISFLVKPFDLMAAVEVASMELQARKRGSKRSPAPEDSPWQKVKVDRQIVAIARIHGAHTIYSDDRDVKNIAEETGIKVISCWELDLPISNTPLLDNSVPPFDLS